MGKALISNVLARIPVIRHFLTMYETKRFFNHIKNLLSKKLFRKKVRSLFGKKGIKVFERPGFRLDELFYPLGSNKSVYIGTVTELCIPEIKHMLIKHRCGNISELNSDCVTALYFENKKADISALIFSPIPEMISLDQKSLHFNTDFEIYSGIIQASEGKKLENLKKIGFKKMMPVFDSMIMEKFGLSEQELDDLKYLNQHKEFVNCYLNYRNDIFPDKYRHIESFSRIYYWDIKIMSEYFRKHPKAGITVHDAATNLGQFPLMLSILNEEQLMGLKIRKIIASDLNIEFSDLLDRFLKNWSENYIPIQILKADLLQDMEKLPETDVIIANDILEHFTEEVSRNILMGLWRKAEKLLIIHVPPDPIPIELYGHLTAFSGKKLRAWAGGLKNGILLSDQYSDNGTLLTDRGYLILAKK